MTANLFRSIRPTTLTGLLIAITLAAPLAAQTNLYWDGNGPGGGHQGDGNWSNGNNRWRDGSIGGTIGTWSAGANAFFGQVSGSETGNVNVNAPITAGSITFFSNGYTLTPNIPSRVLTLNGTGGNITTETNGGAATSATISVIIDGTAGLTKLGVGTLTLSAANTFTGDTTISEGTLVLGHSLALQNSTLIAPTAGTLSFGDLTTASIGGLSGSGNLALTNSAPAAVGLSVGSLNSNTTYSGVLSGSGSLTKEGTGTLSLSGNNTYTGGTTLSAGTLALGSTGALGSSGVISFTGGSLQSSAANTTDYSSRFSDADNQAISLDTNGQNVTLASNLTSTGGSLTKLGSGSLTLSGTNTYSGGTNLKVGTLALGSSGALGSTGPINFNGGSLQSSANNTTDYSSRFSDADNQAISLDTNGQNVTLASTLTNTGGSLTKSGSGTLSLTAANTYTGGTTISAGTLSIGSGSTSGSVAGDITNNATLKFNRSDDFTHAGVISGSGNLNQAGSGTLTLTGTNDYTGSTILNAGTLALGSAGALGSSNANITLNGGTLQFSAANTTDYSNRFNGRHYNFDTHGQDVTFASALTHNSGRLVKYGEGTLTLQGANSYGPSDFSNISTRVKQGTLVVANGGSIDHPFSSIAIGTESGDDATFTIESGATVDSYHVSIGGSGGTGTANVAGTWTEGSASDLKMLIYNNGTLNVLAGGVVDYEAVTLSNGGNINVAGTLSIAKILGVYGGGGRVTITSTGQINSGSVRLGGNNRTGILIVDGFHNAGTSLMAVGRDRNGVLTINAGGRVKNGQAILGHLSTSAHGTANVTGTWNNSSSLLIGNTGRGTLNILAGGLVTNTSGTLGGSSYDNIANISGTWTNSGDLAIGDSGQGTLNLNDGGVVNVNAGAGSVTLAKGSGGGNTNLGTININGDANPGILNASTINKGSDGNNSAVINFNHTNSDYHFTTTGAADGTPITITGGKINHTGIGKTTLAADHTNTGATTVSAGTLQIGNGGTTGSLNSNVTNNASLIFNRSDDYTYTKVISQSGSVTKLGGGTLTLSGANTYTGGTTISAGTLALGHATDTLANSGSVTVSGGTLDLGTNSDTVGAVELSSGSIIGTGTLTGSSYSLTNSGTISANLAGSATLSKTGAGTAILSGNNTHSGATTLTAGTLQLGSTTALGTSSTLDLATGSTLDLNDYSVAIADLDGAGNIDLGSATLTTGNADDHALSGVISGTGSLTKNGSGTTTLSGTNSYTGGTIVSAGTLQGTTASLAGNITNDTAVIFDQTTTGTYSDVISGTGSVAKSGSGSATFSAPQTYTGGTNVSAGTLVLGHTTNTLANSGAVTVSGGTLELGANSDTVGAVTLSSGSITGSGTLSGSSYALTNSGTISANLAGSATLSKTGAGTAILSGNNTHTGGTTISAGTLQIGNGGTTGTLTGNIGNNASLVLNRSDALALAGDISGSGSLTKTGAGTTTLSGNNTFTGGSTLSAGTLTLGSAGALGTSGTISFEGGTLRSSAANTTDYSNRFLNTANQAYALDTNGQTLTLASALSSTSGSLTKSGSGTLSLTADNTYTAGTTISSGTLSIGNGGTTGSITGNVLNNANLTLNRSNALSLSGDISGSGALTHSGSGTTTFSGANTYSGSTTVKKGTLVVSSTGSITHASSNMIAGNTNGDNGTLNIDAHATVSNDTGIIANQHGSTGRANVSGTWTNAGDLWVGKRGNGTLNIEDRGVVNVNSGSGVTRLTDTTANSRTGTLNINGGATPGILNTASIDGGPGTAILNFNHTKSGHHFTTDGTSSGTAINLTGSTRVNHTGSGTTTLNGANTYTGGTHLSGGTLAVAADTHLGTSAGAVNFSGGALRTTASFTADRATTLGTGGGTFNVNNSTTLTWNGDITGAAGNHLTKLGGGTLTLGGTNTYSGDTRVEDGTLKIGSAGALSPNTHLRVQPGAIFNPNGFATALGRLEGDGNINLGSGNLSLNQADNTDFAGVISGTGGLAKSGNGRLSLTGAHTFTGDTDVTEGELKLNGSAANSHFRINGGRLSGSGTTGDLTLGTGGILAPGNSPGTLTVDGNATWEGGASFEWEVNNAAGIISTNWDLLDVNGGLTINATSGNLFTINLVSLTAADIAGTVPNFDPDANASWTFVTTDDGINLNGGSIGASFAINTSGFQNTLNGTFGIAQDGNNLNVTYTTSAVPEPSSYALLLGLIALGCVINQRRPVRRSS